MKTAIIIACLIASPAIAQDYTVHGNATGGITIYLPSGEPAYADRIPGTDRYIISDGHYPAIVTPPVPGMGNDWTISPSPYLTAPDDDGEY